MDSIPSLLNIEPELYWSVIFPIIIALSRVVDVILGTFRIILVIQGRKLLATVFGFFEVLIWVMVAGQVMGELNNLSYYLAWSIGFAAGTYIGMTIEEKISLGTCLLRIIVKDSTENLLKLFAENNIYSTLLDARSRDDKTTTVIFSIVARKKLKSIEKIIEDTCPNAIYTVENVRSVRQGTIPTQDDRPINYYRRVFPRGKSK